MRTLETNDWILLNNIIYKIYTVSDITEMREQFPEKYNNLSQKELDRILNKSLIEVTSLPINTYI